MMWLLSLACLFCTVVAGAGVAALAEGEENFTVSFTTMNFAGEADQGKIHGVNMSGTPLLVLHYEGVTAEEFAAAKDALRNYLWLGGKKVTEYEDPGAHFYVNDPNGNDVNINMPDVKFFGNFDGTNWDYALNKFDYSEVGDPYAHLQNYQIKIEKGFTVGGKTLQEDYERYYNNIAHIFTEQPISPEIATEMNFSKMVVENSKCIQLWFDQSMISQQILWYIRGSHVDYGAALNELSGRTDSSDPNLFVSADDFASAVVMRAAESLFEKTTIEYTSAAGEEKKCSAATAGGDLNFIRDANNPEIQWISVNFSEEIDIGKSIYVTVSEGFTVPSGARMQKKAALIWNGENVEKPVNDFTAKADKVKIDAGETANISFAAEGYYENVTYVSKNVQVATVDANGLVTGVAAGTAEIEVTLDPGKYGSAITQTVSLEIIQPKALNVSLAEGYRPFEGEELDMCKITAALVMTDDTQRPISSDELTAEGYNKDKTGEQTITVKYGTFSATITVMVRAIEVESIQIEVADDYKLIVGEMLDMSKLTMTVTYNNQTSETIAVTADMVAGYDKDVVGEQILTVTYAEKSTTVKVTVDTKVVTEIAVTAPAKTEYTEGEELDTTGGKIVATYNDGTKQTVDLTAALVSGYDKSMVGEQTITVTYEGKTSTFKVTVNAATDKQEKGGCSSTVDFNAVFFGGALVILAVTAMFIRNKGENI